MEAAVYSTSVATITTTFPMSVTTLPTPASTVTGAVLDAVGLGVGCGLELVVTGVVGTLLGPAGLDDGTGVLGPPPGPGAAPVWPGSGRLTCCAFPVEPPPVPTPGADPSVDTWLVDPTDPTGPADPGDDGWRLAVTTAPGLPPEACGGRTPPSAALKTISPNVAAVSTASAAGSDRPRTATCAPRWPAPTGPLGRSPGRTP